MLELPFCAFYSASKIITFNAKRPFGESQRADLLDASHFSSPGGMAGGQEFCEDRVVFFGNRSGDQW